jgi:TRAP-type uncharacterized transport system substrate-binding protein
VPKEIVDTIGPPFVSVTIPANTYTGQDKDVPTAAVINYLVTSSAVSDDLAYQMTKLIYESLPELAMPMRPARRSSSRPPRPAARCRCIPARSAFTRKRV